MWRKHRIVETIADQSLNICYLKTSLWCFSLNTLAHIYPQLLVNLMRKKKTINEAFSLDRNPNKSGGLRDFFCFSFITHKNIFARTNQKEFNFIALID